MAGQVRPCILRSALRWSRGAVQSFHAMTQQACHEAFLFGSPAPQRSACQPKRNAGWPQTQQWPRPSECLSSRKGAGGWRKSPSQSRRHDQFSGAPAAGRERARQLVGAQRMRAPVGIDREARRRRKQGPLVGVQQHGRGEDSRQRLRQPCIRARVLFCGPVRHVSSQFKRERLRAERAGVMLVFRPPWRCSPTRFPMHAGRGRRAIPFRRAPSRPACGCE